MTWGVQNEPYVFVEKHENKWIREHKYRAPAELQKLSHEIQLSVRSPPVTRQQWTIFAGFEERRYVGLMR